LLIKDVVGRYGGEVRFASEDWGSSELATRFGIKRYPVVFVGDVLVAQPKDFGAFGEKGGKYAPWREPANQERFKQDLARTIDMLLRGEAVESAAADSSAASEAASLPQLTLTDLDGKRIAPEQLAGQVVIVEIWATWCPPCRKTLQWLGTVERKYRDRVTVVGLAVESPEADVRAFARAAKLPVRIAIGTPETVARFGSFTSVPVMFVFDGEGRTAAVFHGAPKDLHARVERALAAVMKR
jgi:thiol-disulfide isomerase/thioredoxin